MSFVSVSSNVSTIFQNMLFYFLVLLLCFVRNQLLSIHAVTAIIACPWILLGTFFYCTDPVNILIKTRKIYLLCYCLSDCTVLRSIKIFDAFRLLCWYFLRCSILIHRARCILYLLRGLASWLLFLINYWMIIYFIDCAANLLPHFQYYLIIAINRKCKQSINYYVIIKYIQSKSLLNIIKLYLPFY